MATDLIEQIIVDGLNATGIPFKRDVNDYNFYFTGLGVYIEIKQYFSPRIAWQMSRADALILIKGQRAAELFAKLLKDSGATSW